MLQEMLHELLQEISRIIIKLLYFNTFSSQNDYKSAQKGLYKKKGRAKAKTRESMHFSRSGWGSGGCQSMVFTVRIEGGTFLGVGESGAHIVFYRSDWVLGKWTPLAATLASDSTRVPGLSPIVVFRPL